MVIPFTNKKFLPWADNHKTYIGAAAIIVLGVLQAFGIHVPDWVMWIAGGSTIAAHRASITGLAAAIDDIGSMVMYQNVGQPNPTPYSEVHNVSIQPVYQAASEVNQTKMLNESQLKDNK